MSKGILSKTALALLIAGLILPSLSLAQGPPIEAPKTVDEAKEMAEKGGQEIAKRMPDIIKRIWREQVIPIWQKMWDWFKNIWKRNIQPSFSNLWYLNLKPRIQSTIHRVRGIIWQEVEEQKPLIKGEFEKEKEEMKEELPEASKSLWQRFKELIR